MNDIEFLVDSMGDSVLINDTEYKVLITHSNENKHEERYIHTTMPVKQGDLITYDDEKYLIVTECVTKRANKYKALMRHCNYSIEIPGATEEVMMTDDDGNPIYDRYGDEIFITVETDPISIYTIVDNKSFAISGNQLLLVADNQIIVTVQDNQTNRDKLQVNSTFNVMDNEWKVRNIDKTQKGLLIITCEINV